MKTGKRFFNKIKADFNRIHLVDKYLIVFMAVLLLQSAYSLFVQSSKEAGSIDVIIRTSAAAIFGYFLSANFVNRSAAKDTGKNISRSSGKTTANPKKKASNDSGENTIKNQMGFAIPSSGSSLEAGKAELQSDEDEEPEELTGQLQIVIAATIGLFCLLALIFIRNVGDSMLLSASTSATATVAQFRDFVSGCVGFLIGSPTSGPKNNRQ